MGQGLAPAEPATSAAASCLLRRRRRAIGAIVVCGPSLGCPFDECGAHSAAPDLPAQRFRHERGAKIWIWRPQADRSKIPKGLWEPDLANASPDIARGRVIADVASQRSPTRFTARRAELSRSDTYLTFGQFLSSAASVRTWTAAPQPAAPQGFSISRKPRGTRAVTRRRSERAHRSAHRCKQ